MSLYIPGIFVAGNPYERQMHPIDQATALYIAQQQQQQQQHREYINLMANRAGQPDTTSFSSSKETLAGWPN